MLRNSEISSIFEFWTCRCLPLLQQGQDWDGKGVSGGPRSHQAAGDAQMHGGLAAQELVVELKVAAHACVDSLQGVSPVKGLLPFAGVARTWTEGAHGMLAIIDLDAHDALTGVRRNAAHAVTVVAASTMQSVFHRRASILQRLALLLETGVGHRAHFAALRTNAVYLAAFRVHHCIHAVLAKCPSGLLDFSERFILPHSPGLDERCHTALMQLSPQLVIVQAAVDDKVDVAYTGFRTRQDHRLHPPAHPGFGHTDHFHPEFKRQLATRMGHQTKLGSRTISPHSSKACHRNLPRGTLGDLSPHPHRCTCHRHGSDRSNTNAVSCHQTPS